jgi:hypothetical protein
MTLPTTIIPDPRSHVVAAAPGASSPIEPDVQPSLATAGRFALDRPGKRSALDEVGGPPIPAPAAGGIRQDSKTVGLAARLTALAAMDAGQLRAEWRRLYRALPPSRMSRDLLERGVAWKLQEQAQGGLGAGAARRLADLSKTMSQGDDLARSRAVRLRQGAKLVREWHGQTLTVLVLEGGFEWQGQRWRSLSQIAREITGTRWSGPRFFGLGKGGRAADATPHAGEASDA